MTDRIAVGDLVSKVGPWDTVRNGTLGEVKSLNCADCNCGRLWVKFVGHKPMGVLRERLKRIPPLSDDERETEKLDLEEVERFSKLIKENA